MKEGIRDVLSKIIGNVGQVVIGNRRPAELALLSLLCGGHILIEDVPGVGKTKLVSALARSVACTCRRIQFTPDILPSDVTGFSLYNQKTGEFEFRPGVVFSSFLLADEINRASPKAQSALLEVMQENQVTVDGETYRVPNPFIVMATQNPTEYLGTYPLPEAQMDRFLMRFSLGYPSKEDEQKILNHYKEQDPLDTLLPVATAQDIAALQKEVRLVYVDNCLYEYIVALVQATRTHDAVELGASPRGSLALFHAAQALALYQGRDFVTPDDIKPLCVPVLAHRLTLKQEAKMRQIKQDHVIWDIIQKTTVPTGHSS